VTVLGEMIQKWFSKGTASKAVAKERLRLVLVHARSTLDPETLHALRADLIEVVSRYFEIDRATLSMDVHRTRESWALSVNFPLRRTRSAS